MSAEKRAIKEGLVLEAVLAVVALAVLWWLNSKDTVGWGMLWAWVAASVPAPAWVAIRSPGSMWRISVAYYALLGLLFGVLALLGLVAILLFIGLLIVPCGPPPPCEPLPGSSECLEDEFGDGLSFEGPGMDGCGPGIALLGGVLFAFLVLPSYPITTAVTGVAWDLLGWRERWDP